MVRRSVSDSRGKVTHFLRCSQWDCNFMRPIKNPNGKGRNQNRKTERMNPRRFAAHRKRLEKMIGNANYDSQRFLDSLHLPEKRHGWKNPSQ